MADDKKEQLPTGDLLKSSSLYREFQAEREEILKHKWIESEKAHRDLRDESLSDWVKRHSVAFSRYWHRTHAFIPAPSPRAALVG